MREQRAIRKAGLGKFGIPAPQRLEAVQRLRKLGFEETKSAVRVPLAQQLDEILLERGVVAVAQLAKLAAGATAKECKAAAEAMVRAGRARQALRGKVQVIAGERARTLSREHLAALAGAGKLAQKVLKKGQTLLLDDVRAQLLDVVATAKPALDVKAELARHVRPAVGLSFVPDAVKALASHGVEKVHAALLDAARAGEIELRPESGLNRISSDDLALAPPGPHGTRLTWARIVGGQR